MKNRTHNEPDAPPCFTAGAIHTPIAFRTAYRTPHEKKQGFLREPRITGDPETRGYRQWIQENPAP